jgi:hypothetical protein
LKIRINYFYTSLLLVCFLGGAYYWKFSHTGESRPATELRDPKARQFRGAGGTIVIIDGKAVSSEELDFEYSLLTKGVFDSEELDPIPDLGSGFEKEIAPLKEKLLSSIIERKVLFQFVKRDKTFDMEDPARFTECLQEWQENVREAADVIGDASDKERLKERLCEKSIIMQYLQQQVFSKIEIKDQEIADYYKSHNKEFRYPARVTIRQIVLATEKEAVKVQSGLTRSNFAERAKQFSITPEAEKGGLLGPFAQGEMPGVFEVAFTMSPGSIYGILKSTYGFHLILLEKKLPKQELTLTEATPRIKAILTKKKEEEEYQKWLELALNTINVKMKKIQ